MAYGVRSASWLKVLEIGGVRILMRSIRIVPVVLLVLFALASCSRDPNVVKRRYLESGNKYFEKGRYKEARIKYMNALQKDMRYGPAYYGKGMAELKLNAPLAALQAFRRAKELIPEDQPEHWDAMVKATEILLVGGNGKKEFMDEVDGYCKELLKRDPNSFDGHRLMGDHNFAQAVSTYLAHRPEDSATLLNAAIDEYRKADAAKPKQMAVEVQLARALASKGDAAGAEQLYRQMIEQDKTRDEPYSELYRVYLFQRKPEAGEALLKLAFKNNPKKFDYLTVLAVHYSAQRRTTEMMAVLQEIKSHAPEFENAYIVVGQFYQRLGDSESAIKEYTEGESKDSKRKLLYEKRIIEVLMRQGKKSEAADRTAKILKQDPNDNDAKGLAATFLLDKGDINRAVSELQSVVTRAPENPVARFNLGRAYVAQNQLELARQMFQKAVELRPDYVPARLALGDIQVNRREFDLALKTAQSVLAVDRGNLRASLLESAALMGQKKFGDSRARLEAMMKAAPNSPEVYLQMGVVDLVDSKFKEAEEYFRKSYDLNPANLRGLLGIVTSYIAQNKPEEALALLQAETDKSPNRLDLRTMLAKQAVNVGKYDLALAEYRKVIDAMDKSSRERGPVYLQMGEVYRRKGDDPNAIAVLQKARETMPEDGLVLTTLGLSFDHAGHTPEARQIYEAAIKLDASNGVALNNLAFLLAEHNGDLDDALTKATKAKQLMPNLAEVSDTLGWVYLKKSLSDDAVRIFQDLVNNHPNQATYRYHLAMALRQKGDKPRAIQECHVALKNNPGKDERQKIEDLLSRLNAE